MSSLTRLENSGHIFCLPSTQHTIGFREVFSNYLLNIYCLCLSGLNFYFLHLLVSIAVHELYFLLILNPPGSHLSMFYM